MSERPPFLPAAEFVHVAPEPEGFTAALGRARRRRRRQLGEAGVALSLAVAVLAGFQMPTRDAGQDRVDVVDRAPSTPDTVDDRSTDNAVDDGSTAIALPGATSSPATSNPGSRPAGPARPGTRVTPPATAGQPAPARPRPAGRSLNDGLPYKEKLTRQESSLAGTCVTTQWCLTAYPQSTGQNHWTLDLQVCRAIDAPAVSVEFDSAREAEFVVHNQDAEFWTWSRGQRFAPDPESITFQPGGCFSWQTPYAAVDDMGQYMDPGTYTVTMWSFGSEIGPQFTASSSITVG